MNDTTTPDPTDTPPPGWRGYCYPSCSPTALAMAQDAALALVQRYTMDARDMMEHPEGGWVYMDEVKRRLNEANPVPRKLRILARLPDGTTHELSISGDGAYDGDDMVLVDIQPSMVNDSNRALSANTILADLMRDWKTGTKSSQEVCVAFFQHFSSTPVLGAKTREAPDWQVCERISNEDHVDEAFRALIADPTGDNATGLIQAALTVYTADIQARATQPMSEREEWKEGYSAGFEAAKAMITASHNADHGQQHDDPTGPNHPGHHDGQTCEQAAQAQVDLHEMLYPGSQAQAAYMKEYSQFANSEYGDLNGARTCEQQARDLLERFGCPDAQNLSAGDVVELANLFNRPNGQVYGIIDPDYGRIYTMVRKLAWEEGYAIGLHGSFTRDLDMVACPWADKPCDPAKLIARIVAATGLKEQHGNPGLKPHGRRVWTLLLPEFGDPRFIDLSIMPRLEQASPA